MRRLLLLTLTLCCMSMAHAQMWGVKPVTVDVSIKETSPSEAVITFVATIKDGWHMYSTEPMDGPTPTTFHVEKMTGAQLDGALTYAGKPVKHFEAMFNTDVFYFEKTATFRQKLKLLGGKYEVEGYLEYGACNDQNCTPPTAVDFSFSGETKPHKKEEPKASPSQENAPPAPTASDAAQTPTNSAQSPDSAFLADANPASTVGGDSVADSVQGEDDAEWEPCIDDSTPVDGSLTEGSLVLLFALGFIGGLIALLTPCVWPIIPMTVSFFLKRGTNKNSSPEEKAAAKKRGIRDAILYGLSIIVIYVTLGLVITAIFGPSALNDLATNAVFNLLFFFMLLIFGISFIGGFELTLPSKWNTAVDKKASNTTGLLSIFLMAFTLVLVSFSCTGPIIGFLLVEVATSNILGPGPVIGMLGFAIALALPFTLFALFPQWLNAVPKSGNWMNVVKVTLGFVELAFALKFFSVADLSYHWGLLDREVFLSLWIALAALLGAYLIGWIRFPHDEEEYDEMGNVVLHQKTSVVRFFMALVAFAFAIYMLPGLWGAPLKAISAFAPPMKTQDFNLAPGQEVKPMFTDYEEGMLYAKEHHMPVMIDFTGYGCVNCRKMEAAVFTDTEVADIMRNKYVLIQLYVDDKTTLPEPIVVDDNGSKHKLRTVGDKWSHLQATKFDATTQPFYVLADHQGNLLEQPYSYDEDIPRFLKWLNSGLDRYSQNSR